jgi:heterodisulfide reductase subunit A
MHAMKQAHLARERTGADVYELCVDVRAPGKGYEEFFEKVRGEGVVFVRGRGVAVAAANGQLEVAVESEDHIAGRSVAVDMVVLVTGVEPHADAGDLARTFHITRDKDGFLLEAHPKLATFNTNTEGIFLAGTCQAPRDIPDTVAHANAAAAEAMALMGRGRVVIEPALAEVIDERCSGCMVCAALCPFSAIDFAPDSGVCQINAALCKGCGVCVAACPAGALRARHYTDDQMYAEIEGILAV